ncbi:MAG: sigma-70 family RNA polymerase sigma factor [Candidatus Hydrogenedens sp.]|nr:sigma-70 family RNA polymerase sigma factor [Candidatus Hydrogenedens sp.]
MQPPEHAAWIREALDRYERHLVRYARSITGDVERARDVVQETFLKLCKADRAKVDDHLAAWLYTVARNHALSVVRKEGRMDTLSDAQAHGLRDDAAGPLEQAAANETNARVLALLEQLPEEQREACRLKFQDGLTCREIAQIMEVSLGKVSKLLTGALASLRKELTAGGLSAEEA